MLEVSGVLADLQFQQDRLHVNAQGEEEDDKARPSVQGCPALGREQEPSPQSALSTPLLAVRFRAQHEPGSLPEHPALQQLRLTQEVTEGERPHANAKTEEEAEGEGEEEEGEREGAIWEISVCAKPCPGPTHPISSRDRTRLGAPSARGALGSLMP